LVAHNAISISMAGEIGNTEIYEPRVGETPLWDTIEVSALFESKVSKEIISSFLEGISYSNLYINKLANQNWIKRYQKNFKPKKIGKKLWVVPSWSNTQMIPDGIELKIDPGIAFGSGSHQTTHLCLEYLERLKLKGITILDYGCGSGILSIASLLLGADFAIATDIDPQALISTKDNSKTNNIFEKINIVEPDSIPNIKIDLLIANIFSNVLIEHRDIFSSLLKKDAKIVLSGIMMNQLETILDYYKEVFTMLNVEIKDHWCLAEFEKK